MRRLAWVAFGATLGVGTVIWAWRRLEAAKRAARDAVSPEGISRGVDRVVAAVTGFAGEVGEAAHQREAELRRTLLQSE
ncbi:MAG: hypothetical protein LBD97_02070 [Bifidobacteriaceae bacterium]|nr:hypothetical protein [Bifidobacteriaceae bacterium]